MPNTTDTTVTLGDIARQLGEPEHRIKHVVNTRGINYVRRAGIIRLFPANVVDVIRDELEAIDARRAGSGS